MAVKPASAEYVKTAGEADPILKNVIPSQISERLSFAGPGVHVLGDGHLGLHDA